MIAHCSTKILSSSRLGGLLRDFTNGLGQEMYFLGKDVIHPSGNLLLEAGFTKTPSLGLQGTSCYGCDFQEGRIELHGACAGWYSDSGGFVYIRPRKKCFEWLCADKPVPGQWAPNLLNSVGPARLFELCIPFLDWWISYETWINESLGPKYRMDCHREFRRLPKSKPWLEPSPAYSWLNSLRSDPSQTKRAKCFGNR